MAQAAAAAAAQAATQSVPNGNQPGGLILSSDPTLAPVNASWPTYATQGGRTEVTVTQNASRAILNWTSFNIGKNTDLYFDQTAGGSDASGWVALNRIIGGSPSQILGSIKAEGQVYLINQNGILFGGTSQVNVGSLVLSGLDLSALTKSSGQVVPESSYSAWSQAFVDPSTKLYTLTFVSAPQSDGSVTIEGSSAFGCERWPGDAVGAQGREQGVHLGAERAGVPGGRPQGDPDRRRERHGQPRGRAGLREQRPPRWCRNERPHRSRVGSPRDGDDGERGDEPGRNDLRSPPARK